MFEFDKYVRPQGFRPSAPGHPYAPLSRIDRRSFLVWGEHCVECAAPDCFATCDLYQARPDRRCRRFAYGVYRNGRYPSASGYGAEIVFRTWGKLEARGNIALLSPRLIGAMERGLALAAPVLNRAGAVAGRLLKDIRWSYLTYSLLERFNGRLLRRGAGEAKPDAFAIEIYNPGRDSVSLLFSMSVDRTRLPAGFPPERVPRPLLLGLDIGPGYFRRLVPGADFADLAASGLPFNLAFAPAAPDGVHLVFLTADFVRFSVGSETRALDRPEGRPRVKCVVFDLDDTLWSGVLVEGSVRLRDEIAGLFEALDRRGILISAASKNARDDALAQLGAFGLADYLLHPAIGWGAKSEGLRQIAGRLGIGLDSFMFVDDSPFERDEVARSLPQVEVLDAAAIPRLLDHPRLAGGVTRESRDRRQMYRDAEARDTAAAAFGDDYLDFLRSCAIVVSVRPERADDRERVQELVQRTNQLNFSGRRYDRTELERLLGEPGLERHVIECRDRYGNYGLVGFCLARSVGPGVRIEDLMLSCRVQGKYIENALLQHLCARRRAAPRFFEIRFRPTGRNAAARAVLDSLGFRDAGSELLRVEVPPDGFAADFLTVNPPPPGSPGPPDRPEPTPVSRGPGRDGSRRPSD